MIFYFSGTGNSKHIAEKISNSTGERLIYMSENTIVKNEIYEVDKDEKIGFVFPTYWYSVPTIVEKFIDKLILSGYQQQYVYGIATYGIAAGHVMNRLIKILKNKNLQINGIFGVKMVDNYVIGYDIMNLEKQKRILNSAEEEIDKIISMIKQHKNIEYIKKGRIAFITPVTAYAYRKVNHTKKFYATEVCNGCRKCESGCPCNVIHMENGKPKWTGNCAFCLKCIHGANNQQFSMVNLLKKEIGINI
ncbi:EFR1 family ferrodoxin [Clostridium oryzae]|uniref:Flavodoxin n=1 Tax=Clostridium oryzae TaxID=1450648 RepID=A0A1V4J0R6_9CLOT|nr:EFR1 family ferrodoxin [Clostridium oryzae]OPJ65237.1 flavodoxin [Clostridium oryzae]